MCIRDRYGPGGAPGQYGQGGGAPQYGYGAPAGAYGQPQGYGYGMPPMQVGQYGPPMGYGYAPMGYPPPMYGMQPAWPRPNNRFSGPSTNQQFGMPTGVNPMQGGAGGNTSLMPGDWICDVCENNNFARRRECRRCGTPRSTTSTTIDERSQGQWVPRGRQSAGAAPALTPLALPPGAAAPPGGNLVISAAPSGPVAGGAAAYVPGDWLCASCGNHNFQWRTECKRCNAPRTADAQTIGKDSTISAPAPAPSAPTFVPAAAPAPAAPAPAAAAPAPAAEAPSTNCLLYTSPSPRDGLLSRMPSSA